MVDHVRQYKIPREYLETEEDKKKRKEKEKAKKLAERKKDPANYADEEEDKLSQNLSDDDHSKNSDSDDSDNPEYEGLSPEEIEELKWKKRLYKPTGPDGKGWGDFRTLNAQDLEVLQEFQRLEEKEAKRRAKLDALKELSTT